MFGGCCLTRALHGHIERINRFAVAAIDAAHAVRSGPNDTVESYGAKRHCQEVWDQIIRASIAS
jgi:hypothetical protein